MDGNPFKIIVLDQQKIPQIKIGKIEDIKPLNKLEAKWGEETLI